MIKEFTVIDDKVKYGDNFTIWYFSNINGDVEIGNNCVVGSHCCILGVGRPVTIGNNVRIQSHVFIPGGTVIGDDTFIAPGVVILNDKYPPMAAPSDWKPVVIGHHCTIGGGAVLVPGVKIGNYARIGAGAVVTKDVPDYKVVIGNPARLYDKGADWQNKVMEIESLK